MDKVFIKSFLKQNVPLEYSSGIVLGPIKNKAKCGFKHTLDNLCCRPKKPNPVIESFATLALAAYMADKGYRRSKAPDAWTRDLKLCIPVDPNFLPSVPIITDGLMFLSGDFWQIDRRLEQNSIGARTYYKDDFKIDAACLFSGGLDSLTGAINLLEEGNKIILVSHFESGVDAGIQNNLAALLKSVYGSERVRHLSIQVCSASSAESSTRSRSLLFIALGLMTASTFGDAIPVYIPENCFIGINIPLTGSRKGSYSTRTTHPAFLNNIRKGLQAASVKHEIRNPFTYLSKGEVLKTCKNLNLLKKIAHYTISCAKSGSLRWGGHRPGKNCGFCYPCLMRRAALNQIGEDKPNNYVYDAIGKSGMLADGKGEDLRCLLQMLFSHRKTKRSIFLDMLKSGSLSSLNRTITEITSPIDLGLEEIFAFISDNGCKEIKQYVSI